MNRYIGILGLFFLSLGLKAQQTDKQIIRSLFSQSLEKGNSYHLVSQLSNRVGARPLGSVSLDLAESLIRSYVDSLSPDRQYLQKLQTPKWVRGSPEVAYLETKLGRTSVSICAWEGSVSTYGRLEASLVEINNFDRVAQMNSENFRGKIAFINVEMNTSLIDQSQSYRLILERISEVYPILISYGAKAIIVRSLTSDLDDVPHSNFLNYKNTLSKATTPIPIASISTNGANLVSSLLLLNPKVKFSFNQTCRALANRDSNNIIVEFRGAKFPEQSITLMANLDSSDLGSGAQDNAVGCSEIIETVRLLKAVGYKPRRTIRLVFFIGKNYNNLGLKHFAKNIKNDKSLLVIENETGSFSPLGFSIDTSQNIFDKISRWKPLFSPYNIFKFQLTKSHSSARILKTKSNTVVNLLTNNQRYYSYQNSKKDKFITVSKRELELSSAAMASFVYLVDKYGL